MTWHGKCVSKTRGSRLWKPKKTVLVARALQCPKCYGEHVTYKLMDIAFERCKGCEGIWLDNGELEEIVKRFTGTPLTILAERFFSKGEEIR